MDNVYKMLTCTVSGIEFLRSRLAWYFQPFISNWLIAAAICAALCILFVGLHFLLKPERKVDWEFERSRRAVILFGDYNGGNPRFRVPMLSFEGVNVSGHALHSVHGTVTQLKNGGLTFPLFVAFQSGGWGSTSEIEVVPPNARLALAIMSDGNSPNIQTEAHRLTIDQFLSQFGPFRLELVIDDSVTRYSFSIDQLRHQLEKQKAEEERAYLEMPGYRPTVIRKAKATD